MTHMQSVRLMAGLTSLPKGKKMLCPFYKPLISPDSRRVCRVVVFLNEVVQGRDLETGGVGPLGNQKVV